MLYVVSGLPLVLLPHRMFRGGGQMERQLCLTGINVICFENR